MMWTYLKETNYSKGEIMELKLEPFPRGGKLEFEDGKVVLYVSTTYTTGLVSANLKAKDFIDYLKYNGEYDYTIESVVWLKDRAPDVLNCDLLDVCYCLGAEDCLVKITLSELDLFERNQLF